jgi:hypothetical protein
MFAPPVAKPKAKTASNDISPLHRATSFGQRHGDAEQAPMFRPLPQGGASLNAHGTTGQDAGPASMSAKGGPPPRPSWNFCNVPAYPPGREKPFQMPPGLVPRLPIQAKLKVGAVDDPLEHEADHVADQVMRMPAPDVPIAAAPSQVSRKCAECEDEEKLRKKPAVPETAAGEASGIVHEMLRSPGQPLDPATRAFMEPRLGYDFSKVRIHADAAAAQSARDVDALAYAVGHDVVFGAGQFAPGTYEGRQLIAHELVHVMQQGEAERRLWRAPCRSGAQCQAATPGDPADFAKKVEKDARDREAAQAAAPIGSAEAGKRARRGERAVHFETLLTSHGIPLRTEVGGFFVDPARPPDVLGTVRCRFFPGGSPGTPPAPEDKFCVMLAAEVEDEAKSLVTNAPLSDKQRQRLASLLAIGSHEMQHATFDQSRADVAELARGSGRAGRPECTLDTVLAAPTTVGDVLSEISALTAEFPVYFKNLANQQNPAAAMESHERFNALTSPENLSGAITRLQCGCPCKLVDDFVFTTVMFTTASWPGDERVSYLQKMTRLLPDLWPKMLQVTAPSPLAHPGAALP